MQTYNLQTEMLFLHTAEILGLAVAKILDNASGWQLDCPPFNRLNISQNSQNSSSALYSIT